MLSYRHVFHAGNHADVLKHSVLMLILDYLAQKETPFWYVDTHAGAGLYRLTDSEARKNAEFERGVQRVLDQRDSVPNFVQPYLAAIDAVNDGADLSAYPGSPWFAAQVLRAQDRLRLFEMHPQDYAILKNNFAHDRRVQIADSDGFAGLKALLPPPPRRALVLIDPPYELKEDYTHVVLALQDALRRFSTGIYVIWYPLLSREEAQRLPKKLQALSLRALRIELQVEKPKGEFGMFGSGLFVVNPPWTLHDQMKIWLPQLQTLLGKPGESSLQLESFEA